jgi:hypothetical protein
MRGHFTTIGTQFGRQYLSLNNGKNQAITVSLMQHYLKFYRIYIPKGEDSHRPLGVPVLAWRIFQKMWLPPLFDYTSDLLPEAFHGYIPHRGCGTAWHTILSKVIHKSNIYEIDFKQFFPSVDSDFLLKFMIEKWNISLPVALYLYELNQSLPIFLESKSHDKLHGEVRFTPSHQVSLISNQAKILSNWKTKERRGLIHGLSAAGLEDMDQYFKEEHLLNDYSEPMKPLVVNNNIYSEGNMLTYTPGNTRAWIEAQRVTPVDPTSKLRASFGIQYKGNIGLPQGGTLSPYLSIIYLEEVFNYLNKPTDVEYLFYADDGIFYSDNLSSLENWLAKISTPDRRDPATLIHYNIQVAHHKSAWVKRSGEWLKNLKFLGLTLIPSKHIADFKLVASTRKGSTLPYGRELQELTHFEYAQKLVFDPKAKVIIRKISALKELPMSVLTVTMLFYYESLLQLHKTFSGSQSSLFEYGYFMQKIVSTSIPSWIHGLAIGIFTLRLEGLDRDLINQYLSVLNDNEEDHPDFKEIDFDYSAQDAETMFGSYLNELNSILYSKKELGRHERSSEIALAMSKGLPTSPSPLFVPFSDVDLSEEFSIRGNFSKATTLFELPEAKFLENIRGDEVTTPPPHLFVFFNTLLKPFRAMSLRYNEIFEDNKSFVPNSDYNPDIPGSYPFKPVFHNYEILRNYFRKYQFLNLINSKYYGLIFSRLYLGSLTMEDFEQDFSFGYVHNSLAELIHRKSLRDPNVTIFTGSSYATHEITRFLAFLGGQTKFEESFLQFGPLGKVKPVPPKSSGRFIWLKEGTLPPNSW